MDSKEFNVQVVKDFLAEAKKVLATLEYNDYDVAQEADSIISGCVDELEELVAEYGSDLEQDDVELPECVSIAISELALDVDAFYYKTDGSFSCDKYALGEIIEDYLSDTYGFCHRGCNWEFAYCDGKVAEIVVTDIQWDVDKEEELTVVRTMDELEAYLEDNGWTVEMDDEGWEIGQCSPAGEDFWFYIRHDNDVEKAVKEIQRYAYDFDIDEHVQLNLGGRGAPGVTELVEDAHAIQEMLNELADGVNWCEKKTIREIVAEAHERAVDSDATGKEPDFELE